MGKKIIFEQGLDRNTANFAPLTPISFIQRTAAVYPDHLSVVHGNKRYTWSQTYARCRRLASALAHRGIAVGETVAVIGSNTPEMLEAAFGVPMSGAVLNTLNVRLDAKTIAYCLNQGEAKLLITDTEFSQTIKEALAQLGRDIPVIDIDDSEAGDDISHERLGEKDYEALLEEGDADFDWNLPADEWQAISLNYTSGTTGNPKGVCCRGVALALGTGQLDREKYFDCSGVSRFGSKLAPWYSHRSTYQAQNARFAHDPVARCGC